MLLWDDVRLHLTCAMRKFIAVNVHGSPPSDCPPTHLTSIRADGLRSLAEHDIGILLPTANLTQITGAATGLMAGG